MRALLVLLLALSAGAAPGVARDGSELLLIPAGAFVMGSDEGSPDQSPRRVVDLPAFYVGRTEVTNRQFRRFLQAAGRPAPDTWAEAAARYGEDAPALGVSWVDASDYCAWAGLRLPTEAEWEKAARGSEGRRYPWGSGWDPSRVQRGAPGPGGSHPAGAAACGALDMAGNAWEWTSSWYEGYPGTQACSDHFGRKYRVLRGGSWQLEDEAFFRTTDRGWSLTTVRFAATGFRVAADPP